MEHRTQDPSQVTDDMLVTLVERATDALLELERRFGTRALALAVELIESADTDESGYAERRWAAMPELRERLYSFAQAVYKADGREGDYAQKPVTGTPLPASAAELGCEMTA